MNPQFKLGSVAGVPIGGSWSWLAVFGLIVWTLTASVFPDQNPGLGTPTYIGMGIAAALIFYASLLLHELGHALQARREGVPIIGITLWLFGGVARFGGDFPSAGAELRIALAGPAVSLALGAAFVGLAATTDPPAAVGGVVAWLGYINLTLLVFNMLPAFPMDGGRVLRSLLWLARGDMPWATRIASTVGRGFGAGFVALGLAAFAVSAAFAGLWLAFLGWFLFAAATAEARHTATQSALGGITVGDLMMRWPVTLDGDMLLADAIDLLAGVGRHTAYPVLVDGRLLGVVELARLMRVPRAEWGRRRVRECLLELSEVPVLREDEGAGEALDELARSRLGRGLVLDRGRLVGLLSMTDIARALRPPIRPMGGSA